MSASPAAVLGFLWWRTARNAVVTKVGRMREPRYLIGGLLALAWFSSLFRRGGPGRGLGSHAPKAAEILALLEPTGAFVLAVLVALWWLFVRGKSSLPLSESEVQFLFPAPLPRSAILHFAVLKGQVGLLFSALILALVTRRAVLPGTLRGTPSLFVLMATLQLHYQGLSLRRAAWREAPPVRRTLLGTGSRAVALIALAALALLAAWVVRDVGDAMNAGATSLTEVGAAVNRSIDASRPGWLLFPLRALVAPLFARDIAGFLRTLPVALLLLVLNHFWVVRAQVSYEDATVENAARRARLRARGRTGRLTALPSEKERTVQPFALAADGPPETALLWKSLLAAGRARLSSRAAAVAAVSLALFGAARLAAGTRPDIVPVLRGVGFAIAAIGLFLGIVILPMNLRLDFRRDLTNAAAMKLWPIPATRLAFGELAAPLLVSTGVIWTALAASLAMSAGAGAAADLPLERQVPFALGAAILAPAVASIVLVVQNGLTLAFPMWFPPGEAPSRGFAASGSNLLGLLATLLLLAVGALPSAALAAGAVAAGSGLLGFWIAPVAAALAALPLLAEAAGAGFLLGRLFERFDPSRDLEGS